MAVNAKAWTVFVKSYTVATRIILVNGLWLKAAGLVYGLRSYVKTITLYPESKPAAKTNNLRPRNDTYPKP